MTYSTEALANRTVSAYPISIGTSFALESLGTGPNPTYDPDRVPPPHVDITQYEEVWINLFTLFRNICGALGKDDFNKIMPEDTCDVLDFEVEVIKKVIEELSFGKTKAIFYASDYSGLNKKYPHARVRSDTTDKQKIYTSMLTSTVSEFFKRKGKTDYVLHFDLKLEPKERKKVLIITNYAFDLLSYKNFKELDLLESHTGVLKTHSMWYTKFQDHKNLMRIPFAKWSIQVFGDSSTFYPWPKATRDEIIALADKYKWTNTTTIDRIKMCIRNLSDPYAISVLGQMLH